MREVSGYETLVNHPRFQEIILREVEMMFPPEKTAAKPTKLMSGDESD